MNVIRAFSNILSQFKIVGLRKFNKNQDKSMCVIFKSTIGFYLVTINQAINYRQITIN